MMQTNNAGKWVSIEKPIVCAHKSFCFSFGMNSPNNVEKRGSRLANSVKWPFSEIWHYIRACMYYILYIKGHVKSIKLKSI